jgi:hypothetical protein
VVAPGGIELDGVHSSLHQEAGLVCPFLEQPDQFLVWGKQDFRDLVVAESGAETGVPNGRSEEFGNSAGQPEEKVLGATLRVLMKVGVPGSRERETEAMGDESTEDPHVIGTGDVHDVGIELANGLLDRITTAQEGQVEIMFLVECKRDPSTLELHAAS